LEIAVDALIESRSKAGYAVSQSLERF
jgi:hypothetical protein